MSQAVVQMLGIYNFIKLQKEEFQDPETLCLKQFTAPVFPIEELFYLKAPFESVSRHHDYLDLLTFINYIYKKIQV